MSSITYLHLSLTLTHNHIYFLQPVGVQQSLNPFPIISKVGEIKFIEGVQTSNVPESFLTPSIKFNNVRGT